ncbi:MAG: sugar phosphate isomerase/epimerase [Desulfobacterales bacterium]|nr:sugar phosphate isomerase/epimerase [Desulfobacterales bacterium]
MKNIPPSLQDLLSKVQINIPFTMLHDTYLDRFLKKGLNPEIGIDALALERFTLADFKRIAKMLHDHSLSITLHGPFIDLSTGSTDPAVIALTRSRFEQLLKLVPVFRPKTVVCHAGYDWRRYGYFKEEWIENSLKTWSWLANRLNEQGTKLMLENVYEDSPEDIRIIFERLRQQHVGFCLDSGHLSAFGEAPLKLWLNSLGPYIGQLHLHDNHGRIDEHLAMGLGTIDFDLLFNYLKTNGKSPPIITLEPHREPDLWPSLEYLARVWPW